MTEPSNNQPSLRDRAMAILLELQAEERGEINAAEKQALAQLGEKEERRGLGSLGLFEADEEQ